LAIHWQPDSFSQVERSIAAVVLPGKLLIAGRSRAFAYLFAFATYSVAPEGLLGAATNRRELLGLLRAASGEVFVVLHDEMLDHYGEGLLEEIRSAKADAGGRPGHERAAAIKPERRGARQLHGLIPSGTMTGLKLRALLKAARRARTSTPTCA
jgi:hypothetical protein